MSHYFNSQSFGCDLLLMISYIGAQFNLLLVQPPLDSLELLGKELKPKVEKIKLGWPVRKVCYKSKVVRDG